MLCIYYFLIKRKELSGRPNIIGSTIFYILLHIIMCIPRISTFPTNFSRIHKNLQSGDHLFTCLFQTRLI